MVVRKKEKARVCLFYLKRGCVIFNALVKRGLEMNIRLCHPNDFLMIYGLRNIEKCTFQGELGEAINGYLQPFLNRHNITCELSANKGFGRKVGPLDEYTGCLGLLQRNESDVFLQFGDYPMDITNVTQGDLVLETNMAFMQIYYQFGEYKKLQLLSALFSALPILPYILFYLLTVFIVLRASVKMMDGLEKSLRQSLSMREAKKRNHYHFVSLIAHASRIGSLEAKCPHTRIIFISVSIFALLVIQFILISIKTELVVVDEPTQWHNYDDMIADQVLPVFPRRLHVAHYFRDAEEGSAGKKLWKYATKHFNLSQIMYGGTQEGFRDYGSKMIARRAAIILDATVASLMHNAACQFRRYNILPFMNEADRVGDIEWRLKNFFHSSSSDAFSGVITKGLIYTESLRSSKVGLLFGRFIKSGLERGLQLQSKRRLISMNTNKIFESILQPNGQSADSVRECLDESHEQSAKEKEENQIVLVNTKTLFIAYVTIIAASLFVLLFEVSYAPVKARKNIKSKAKRGRCNHVRL